MPRRTNRRPSSPKKRKQYNEQDMARAIKAVREKTMGYLKAARSFNVPRTTLFRLSRDGTVTPESAAVTKLGRKCILGSKLEKELVEYILAMESKFYGLTSQDMAHGLSVGSKK
ncbi:unnamed protein product [Acanthoscelides obtectus]|uniref:HTH psq-type domain-containing protein n=1 Tax=Acanthoscelides obtectus TaxID=200917 RepID=A0A9P0KLJ8_ACAOB|nr:unnamed protein product [Acanthoscelides obtectus]CAK1669255.1 hypothetical protein AOBTE_LOCUS26900 [Acanthoscelides obtectus]